MDLHEDSEANTVTATFELPGIKKEDVQIELYKGRLTNYKGYAIRERRFGKMERILELPQGVQPGTEIKASMDNGVLTVVYPKSTPEQAPKKITIS
ncbi:small heat shock protein [Mycena olivaceomarginata]|nr:small heat shock protein [Mycena olivaceomarginata]